LRERKREKQREKKQNKKRAIEEYEENDSETYKQCKKKL